MNPTRTIYLAGPIAGLSYGDARHGWREEFASMLPEHILPVSPMRAKEFLAHVKCHGSSELDCASIGNMLASASGIVTRDHNDVMTCDAMVACFLGVNRASLGTAIEFGWANAYRKPVVMIAERGSIHDHAMMTEIAGYVVPTLEEAAHIVTSILTPGV